MSRFYCSKLRFPQNSQNPNECIQFLESAATVPIARVNHTVRRLFPGAMLMETREVSWLDVPDDTLLEQVLTF